MKRGTFTLQMNEHIVNNDKITLFKERTLKLFRSFMPINVFPDAQLEERRNS